MGEILLEMGCLCAYLVAEGALFGADISDQVSRLLGHLIQKHVAQGQASVAYVVTLETEKTQQLRRSERKKSATAFYLKKKKINK